MKQLRAIAFGLVLAFAVLPALAQNNQGAQPAANKVPAPLAGAGLPALAVAVLGYFIHRVKSQSNPS